MKRPASLFIAATVLFISAAAVLSAAELISYQGRLTSSGLPVADGPYSITFKIYTDSTGGSLLWQESAGVAVQGGLFGHQLGSVSPLPVSAFAGNAKLFLQVEVNAEPLAPRTRLVSAPTAASAHSLRLLGDSGNVIGRTADDSGGVLQLYTRSGQPGITLRGGWKSDTSVVLPDSAINSDEIQDEPGIANRISSLLIDLSDGAMTDLLDIEIEIPYDGYIVLNAKCYILLSGTTGPNGAIVQIDATEGGPAIFPHYTHAGLSGFVNTGTNYFPAFVTRTYYREAGIHEFRLEGKADHPLPAVAQTWDHVITAMYFPTAYGPVSYSTMSAEGNPNAVPVTLDDPRHPERNGTIYELDLRYLERESKRGR